MISIMDQSDWIHDKFDDFTVTCTKQFREESVHRKIKDSIWTARQAMSEQEEGCEDVVYDIPLNISSSEFSSWLPPLLKCKR